VPAEALALVLCAAGLHALWNVLLAGADDVEGRTAAALLVGCAVFAPVAIAGWDVEPGAWPYVAASAALELTYFALLAAAYRRSELSLVYPLTRGLAPVLVLLASVVILGLGTSAGEAVGVVLVGIGIVAVRGVHGRMDWTELAFVAAIACAIASYTLVDRYGIERASAVTYLELVIVPAALAYAAAIGRRRVRAALEWRTAVAGVAMFGAYVLVLLALRIASAASVAAVRETGIVIAVGLAILVLREPVGPLRIAGAATVAAGVALIAVS
jgi:drug/metabolite transporter (DMT)-like permease